MVSQVTVEAVREAYSAMAEPYIDLFNGDWLAPEDEAGIVQRHLAGLSGRVLELGCGPGYWTAYLESLGVDVTGVDVVPEFIAHARLSHPGSDFRLGSMTELDVPAHSVPGIVSWYSTIHLPPLGLVRVLAEFQQVLSPAGVLVLGFFDTDDDVAAFDHRVITAYRWPADVLAEHRRGAGFTEVERVRKQELGCE